MKKSLIAALIIGGLIPETVLAQAYYNQGYYNAAPVATGYAQPYYQQPQQQQVYYQQQPQQQAYYQQPQVNYQPRQQAEPQKTQKAAQTQNTGLMIGPISVGADYVFGIASYKTENFEVPSALTGGEPYKASMRSFERNNHSLSFNLGFRPFKHLGIEAFYQQSLPQKKVAYTESYSYYPEFARGEYEISYKVYGLDLLGYMPMNDFIEVIASIGVGKYDAEAKVKVVAYENNSGNKIRTSSKTFSDSTFAYRIGGGVQFWLSRHLAFRLMGRWTQIGGDFMNYITEVNAGVRYHF